MTKAMHSLDAELGVADVAEVDVLGVASVLVARHALLRRLVAAELARYFRHARVAVQQLVLDALARVLRHDVS